MIEPEKASVNSQGSTYTNEKRNTYSSVQTDVGRTESYSEHINYINEYIQNKMKEQVDSVTKMRSHFGTYTDSFGFSKASVYLSENELATLSLQYSPNGEIVIAGFGSGTLKVFDANLLIERNTPVQGKENGYGITCIRFEPNNSDRFYASTCEGIVLVYDLLSYRLNTLVKQLDNEINAIDINLTNTVLVTGGKDKIIHVYDIATQSSLSLYIKLGEDRRQSSKSVSKTISSEHFHKKRIYGIKFNPDNPNVFISGGWDNMLKMWDLRMEFDCVKTIFGPHISGDAIDIRGNTLLTGSWQAKNTLALWDVRNYKLIKYVVPINSPKILEGVYTFTTKFFDRDKTSDIILHGSLGYKTIDVISIEQNIILHSFPCGKSTVAVDSSNSNIVFGGSSNVINFVFFFMNLLIKPNERLKAADQINCMSAIKDDVTKRFVALHIDEEELESEQKVDAVKT